MEPTTEGKGKEKIENNTQPQQPNSTAITPSTLPQPAVEVADDSRESDSDDGTNSDSEEQNNTLAPNAHQNPPQIPDSEEHEVSFLGRLLIKGTDREPPTGAACATSVDFLARLSRKQRRKFRGNCAVEMKMVVSSRAQAVVCVPQRDREAEIGLSCNLINVTCVADHGKHICFITAKLQPDRVVKFHAFAFVCESEFASRYLAEEVVRACRHVFMLRRMQRVHQDTINRRQQAASPRSIAPPQPIEPPKPKKPEETPRDRKPNEADKLFLEEWKLLQTTIAAITVRRKPNSAARPRPPPRGDGIYYECCKHLGGCSCNDLVAAPIKASTNSSSNLVVQASST